MNITKVTQATRRAEHYLIRRSFLNDDGTEIGEEEIDALYEIYPLLVSELKRVNGIIDAEDKELINAMTKDTEQSLKKQ